MRFWYFLQLFAFWVSFLLLLSSADFLKSTFQKQSFRNTIRVSNSLDPEQDRHSVGPDLGPNCLQGLSADEKVGGSKERVKHAC